MGPEILLWTQDWVRQVRQGRALQSWAGRWCAGEGARATALWQIHVEARHTARDRGLQLSCPLQVPWPGLDRRPMTAQRAHSVPSWPSTQKSCFLICEDMVTSESLSPSCWLIFWVVGSSVPLHASLGLFRAQHPPLFRKKPIHVHLLERETGENVDLSEACRFSTMKACWQD